MTARQGPRKASREQRVTRQMTWLLVAAGMLRRRPFQEKVILGAIAAAALAGMGKESQTRNLARMAAYVKRLDQRALGAVKVAGEAGADAVEKATEVSADAVEKATEQAIGKATRRG